MEGDRHTEEREMCMKRPPLPTPCPSALALLDAASVGSALTFTELRSTVLATDVTLSSCAGVCPGDVVLLVVPNCMLYPVCFFTVTTLVAVAQSAAAAFWTSTTAGDLAAADSVAGDPTPADLAVGDLVVTCSLPSEGSNEVAGAEPANGCSLPIAPTKDINDVVVDPVDPDNRNLVVEDATSKVQLDEIAQGNYKSSTRSDGGKPGGRRSSGSTPDGERSSAGIEVIDVEVIPCSGPGPCLFFVAVPPCRTLICR
ncbi:hypothetical protein ABZP36_002112 [Zizania latifolia]